MSVKFFVKGGAGNLILALGLGLAVTVLLLLAGCGSSTTLLVASPGPDTTSPTSTTTAPSSSLETQTVTQPKVVAQGRDAQGGKIEFTEPPVAGDRVPVFIMFETEN
jgi:uncharacterized protein YceK